MFNILKVLLSSVIPKGFIFILNLVLARSLSLNEFGLYSYIKSFYNFFETIISSSLVPHSISSISNKVLRVEQVAAIYFLFAVLSSFLSLIVIVLDGTVTNIYIPIILFIAVFGSIMNSYMYVRCISADKINILLLSSFLTVLILCFILFSVSISSSGYAVLFAFSFNCLDCLFKMFFLQKSSFKFNFEFKNLRLNKPIFLISSLAVNGIIFLLQRMLLVRTENGLEQMAYLEIVMIIFSLIAIFLSSQGNYLMARKQITFLKYKVSAIKLMLFITLASSSAYALVILFGSPGIYWIFNIRIPQSLCIAASVMIFSYSIAFYSVRVIIMKNMQHITLYSTLISAVFAFLPYAYLDISAISIVLSYAVFYFFLSLINYLFIYGGSYEIKEPF
jgi:hypothetical protein